MGTQRAEPDQATSTAKGKRFTRAKARENKRAIVGYYSPEMCSAIKELANIEGKSIQAIVGESLDMLLEARGYHSFNER